MPFRPEESTPRGFAEKGTRGLTMRHVVGVDGGATKTHALVVAESGQVAGFGQGGPSNHQVVGLKSAIAEVKRAVCASLDAAGLSPEELELGCFCLAGADLPEDYAMLQEAVEALRLVRSVLIRNDTMAALRAGLTRSWGVVVICGTGFNAAGRAPDGREIVLPGLGTISGDWGAGTELSLEIIRLVMRAWDGRGNPTLLTRMVLEAFDAPSEETLLRRLYHGEVDPGTLQGLAPLLFEAAEAGDEVARGLVVKMGTEVGVSANALVRRLGLQAEDVEVVMAGSVFKGRGPLLLDTVRQVIQAEAPRASIVSLVHEPVFGAALLALEAADVPVTPQIFENLGRTSPI